MRVDIYIEVAEKHIRSGVSSYAYLLEYIGPSGQTHTRGAIACMEATGNRMVLAALVRALERLNRPVDIVVHTDLRYLQSALQAGWLISWKENGWVAAKGKEIKNRDLWEQIVRYVPRLSICYGRSHAYSRWMKQQMKEHPLKEGEMIELQSA